MSREGFVAACQTAQTPTCTLFECFFELDIIFDGNLIVGSRVDADCQKVALRNDVVFGGVFYQYLRGKRRDKNIQTRFINVHDHF